MAPEELNPKGQRTMKINDTFEKVIVEYVNDYREEYETYEDSLAAVLETFDWDEDNGITKKIQRDIQKAGKAIVKNGFATTTITLINNEQ